MNTEALIIITISSLPISDSCLAIIFFAHFLSSVIVDYIYVCVCIFIHDYIVYMYTYYVYRIYTRLCL